MNAILKYSDKDPKLMSGMEIMGAYFVDFYYMKLYEKSVAELSNSSLTENYKERVLKYSTQCDKYIKVIIKSLYQYSLTFRFCETLDGFEVKFLRLFIPDDFLKGLSSTDKTSNVTHILKQIISLFTKTIIGDLKNVIDNRISESQIRIYQDLIIEIMFNIRDQYYKKLTKQIICGDDKTKAEAICDKLYGIITQEANLRMIAENERISIEQKYNQLVESAKAISNSRQEMLKSNEILISDLELRAKKSNIDNTIQLKKQITSLETLLSECRSKQLETDEIIRELREKVAAASSGAVAVAVAVADVDVDVDEITVEERAKRIAKLKLKFIK